MNYQDFLDSFWECEDNKCEIVTITWSNRYVDSEEDLKAYLEGLLGTLPSNGYESLCDGNRRPSNGSNLANDQEVTGPPEDA